MKKIFRNFFKDDPLLFSAPANGGGVRWRRRLLAVALAVFHIFTQTVPLSYAEVVLDNVENGQVSVETHEGVTTITAQEQAIANFSAFNTAAGETLNINILGADGNPLAAAAALFRIGGGATEFAGIQNIIGTLFLTNLSGFHFAASSETNVTGALVASTLGMSNENFLAGQYALQQDSSMAPGFIFNEGRINGFDQSAIALVAGAVRNTGSITLRRESWTPPESFAFGEAQLKPLAAGEPLAWRTV